MKKLLIVLALLGTCSAAPPPRAWRPFQHHFSLLATMFPDTRTGGGSGGSSYACCTDNGTQFVTTEPIRLPLGAAGADALQFGAVALGFYSPGANQVNFDAAGLRLQFSNNGVGIGGANGGLYSPIAGTDTFFGRRTTANWQLGTLDLNGSPVSQTTSVQGAVTGSNLSGAATFSLAASLGTGTGTPGMFQVLGGAMGASGTTAQVGVSRMVINDTKQLTSGAATTALSVPLPTLQMMGGTIDYYIEATDGTNQCVSKNTVQYAGENSAGVFKVTATKVIATSVTNCTGAATLTEAWTITSADPALIQVTPTLSFGSPTLLQIVYEVHHMGRSAPTL